MDLFKFFIGNYQDRNPHPENKADVTEPKKDTLAPNLDYLKAHWGWPEQASLHADLKKRVIN